MGEGVGGIRMGGFLSRVGLLLFILGIDGYLGYNIYNILVFMNPVPTSMGKGMGLYIYPPLAERKTVFGLFQSDTFG